MRWSERARGGRYGAVQLCAPLLSVQRSIANTAFSQIGRQMHELPAGSIPTEPRALDELARAWEREAALHASGLFINATDSEPHERIAVGRLIDRVSAPVIVATRGPVPLHARDVHIVYVEPVSHAERRGVWQRALASRGVALDGMLDRLAAQFELEPAAVQEMVSSADLAGDDFGSRLWSEARIASRTDVNDIAERLRTTACFDDLVLPAEQTAVLHDIVAHVRNRTLVYEHWGMAGSATRALGVTALFVGPSGTGKTLAAEVLGNELDLDVLRVDLSAVVSKYIGETEKNLQRAFDAAERSGAILLFDECDALFGKRGEVQFGHDRYANIEVSYLLQRMESYRGLAILTSNMRTAIDPAFMRRLQFVIPFPFPDYDARLAMWRRIFGPGVPTENLDERRLATLSVTGANIRNIAIYAAFLAADAGGAVRMHHLHRAALTECAKIERTPSDVEIGGWI